LPLALFPEGGISEDGTLRDFQPGIGLLLLHQDLQAVPVFIEGAYEALPVQRRWPRRRRISVTIGEALTAKELAKGEDNPGPEAVAKALREKVAALQARAQGKE
jgi:long-chain acyl-CoA synthetase